MKTSDQIFGCIGAAASVVLIVVAGTIISGWALSVLWGWFIVPVFDLPGLSIIQAIGIALIIGYIKGKSPQRSDDRKASDKLIESIGYMFMMPLLSIGIGWIVLQFM